MKSVFTKPAVWIAAGIAVGALSIAAALRTDSGRPALNFSSGPVVTMPARELTKENISLLRELDESFASIADTVNPSVVHIRADGGISRDESSGRFMRAAPEGSGVIYRSDGYILTNDHVVSGQKEVTVTLTNGKQYKGKVIGSNDRQADIAVIKVDATNLPAAKFANSSAVRVGQFAIAVGSPFGLEHSVTVGHVSALGRNSVAGDPTMRDQRGYSDLIQTDAPINQGNSGGPLVNIEGEVIGINSTIVANFGGGSTGIGFAIPSNQAALIADILIEKGKLDRAYLGVFPQSLKPYQKEELKLNGGAILEEVPNEGPAYEAGIRKGDVVVRIGDLTVNAEQDLRNAMLKYSAGNKVPIEVVRDGQRKTFQVSLGKSQPLGQPEAQVPQTQRNGQPFQFGTPDEMRKFLERFNTPERGDDFVPPLREGRPRLGVTAENLSDSLRKQFNIPADAKGVVVKVVESGSIAEANGLKVGDVIESIDGTKIGSVDDLRKAMGEKKWGDGLTVKALAFEDGAKVSKTFSIEMK